MGFDVAEDEKRLIQQINNSEFSLQEIGVDETDGEIVEWRSHRGGKGKLRPILLSGSNLVEVMTDDSIGEESQETN